jgi:hypothetical protein
MTAARLFSATFLLVLAATSRAHESKRIVPPQGSRLAESDRAALSAELDRLTTDFQSLPRKAANANAEVFLKAVRYALELGEFHKPDDATKARRLLAEAATRIAALRSDEAPWLSARGLVTRGYYSAIDGSPQPFALEIPDDAPATAAPAWIWLHGRSDTGTDLHFLSERMQKKGQFQLSGTIVVHPFGRFCTGYKNAGEQDVIDVHALLVREKRIDPARSALAGFSMGGAGAWMIGAHYTDRWKVVHTGAGFVDVRRYRNLADSEVSRLPPWEVSLWAQNDVPTCVRNLLNLPVISYSGEKDRQRASAEIMAAEFQKQGAALTHLIGPDTEHKYEPATQRQLTTLIQDALLKPKENPYPLRLSWQGQTLDYPRLHWIKVTGLHHHWQDARIDASIDQPIPRANTAEITTANVASLLLTSTEGQTFPTSLRISIDGQSLSGGGGGKAILLSQHDGRWLVGPSPSAPPLRKKPGLQGPIDDAFTAPFLFVLPDQPCASEEVESWVQHEISYQTARWKWLMRGDLRTRKASEVSADDIRRFHLILWGDPKANALTAKVIPQLPIQWDSEGVTAGTRSFRGPRMIPSLIYPNPLNPERYVVLNSGLTFRESHSSTNSLQNPKLPDWAIINIQTPPDDEKPGHAEAAGFFSESWQLTP